MINKKDKLYLDILKALRGRRLWRNLIKNHKISNMKYVILFPSLNTEYNYLALFHLEHFLNQRKAESAVIITHDKRVIDTAHFFTDKIMGIEFLSENNIKNLIKFYCLYEFTDRLIIASLEDPEGRIGKNIIGKNGLTLDEVFRVTVYSIADFTDIESSNIQVAQRAYWGF